MSNWAWTLRLLVDMPKFTELEKGIIRKIALQGQAGERMLGELVKDLLFESGKSAFVICGRLTSNSSNGRRVSALLSAADGGREQRRTRERVVSFVSLMEYLIRNRLVYPVEHDQQLDSALFYQSHTGFSLDWKFEHANKNYNTHYNTYRSECGEGDILRIDEILNDTGIIGIRCKGLILQSGEYLVNAEFSSEIKESLSHYLTCHVYPSVALKDLVENDFQTVDERVAAKSIQLAAVQADKAQKTLIVAVITLFVALVMPLLEHYAGEKVMLLFVALSAFFTMGWMMQDGK